MKQNNEQIQQELLLQTQQQNLSAQQVIAVRLTELSLEALEQRVENECMENPWLEKESLPAEEIPMSDDQDSTQEGEGGWDNSGGMDDMKRDYRSEDDIPEYLLQTRNESEVTGRMEYGGSQTFYDMLMSQVGEYNLSEHEQQLVEYLIGSLDDNGRLKKSLWQLADEMEIYHAVNTSEEEMEKALKVLQQFDPPGVGARSLQECLLLQVRRDFRNPLRPQLIQVLEESYDDFIHKHWDRISRRMKLTKVQTDALQRELMKLNPRPGSAGSETEAHGSMQITPDFFVETDAEGHITMTLNQGNVPSLTVSPDATEKLKRYEGEKRSMTRAEMEDLRFTRGYVERGQIFINALAMRRDSMKRTMEAIIRLQRPFFLEGDETLLKPMILDDVARLSGISISVVSRVCNSKYVQTSFGTYPLKWFFSHKAAQAAGDEVSNRQLMIALKGIIEAEDRQNPWNDEQIAQMMEEKGFPMARRTVAKYREQMGIPPARLRK